MYVRMRIYEPLRESYCSYLYLIWRQFARMI
nr:MAG TPA: hypothetical protein [Caudoviricetes sp.]